MHNEIQRRSLSSEPHNFPKSRTTPLKSFLIRRYYPGIVTRSSIMMLPTHFFVAFSLLVSTSCNAMMSNSSKVSNIFLRRSSSLINALSRKVTVTLELINADTDTPIGQLRDGQVIDVSSITGMTSPSFNIQAIITSNDSEQPSIVASVTFGYNAVLNAHVETTAPYAFCGNVGRKFPSCRQLRYGTHTVQAAVLFADPTVNGTLDESVSITFTIVPRIEVPASLPPARSPPTSSCKIPKVRETAATLP